MAQPIRGLLKELLLLLLNQSSATLLFLFKPASGRSIETFEMKNFTLEGRGGGSHEGYVNSRRKQEF